MKITAIQTDIAWCDTPRNLALATTLILESEPADLYILPEMFTTGFICHPQKNVESDCGITLDWMKKMANDTNASIAGSVAVRVNDKSYRNRFYFVMPDGTYHYYDKHHLFTYADEHLHYTPGTVPVIVQWHGVNIMLQVCYDLRFPCFSRNRNYAQLIIANSRQPKVNHSPYDLCLYVANWPSSRRTAWDVLLRARAIENQCYVVGVNRIGDDPTCHYNGGTTIIDPYGNPLATAHDDQTCTITATLDLNRLQHFRDKFPVLRDAD